MRYAYLMLVVVTTKMLVVAAATTASAATVQQVYETASSAPPSDEACYVLPLDSITSESLESTRTELLRQGWRADPTDSLEGLYSPQCPLSQAIERRALLEEVRALRAELDGLRLQQEELLNVITSLIGAWNELLTLTGGGD